MSDFKTLVQRYRGREKSALVDSIAAGLSFADEISVDLGILEDSGLASELLDTVSLGLPFAIIALTEGGKVLLKKKTAEAGWQDAAYRTFKTGAAVGAGAAVAAAGAAGAAFPVALGTRLLIEKTRSNALTGHRVQQRIRRVRQLRLDREARLSTHSVPLRLGGELS